MAAENAEAAEGPGTEANQVVSPFSNIVCEYLNMCPKFVRLLQLYFLHFHFLFTESVRPGVSGKRWP